jgi:CRISPR system Cascade subunit CasE
MTGAVLARIRLNHENGAVRRDLRDAAELHRTIMRLVPDNLGDHARQQTGLLFRVDTTDYDTILLVQSSEGVLDPARLPAGYGTTEIKDLAPMFKALRPGLQVRYRITANPSKRQRLGPERPKERGKVIPLTGPDADQWWARRAAEAGLRLHTLLPTPLDPARSRGKSPGPKHCLVRFEGTASVTDADTLAHAIRTGIGKGKPYGAGLLSLAPARTS